MSTRAPVHTEPQPGQPLPAHTASHVATLHWSQIWQNDKHRT